MKKRFVLLIVVLALLVPSLTAAAEATACDSGEILPPCTCSGNCQLTDFVQLFVNLYAFGLHVAAPLALFFMVIGGVLLVTASGYKARIDMGKNILSQAITGLVIILISWVIVDTAIFIITGNRDQTVFGKKWYGGFTYVCNDDELKQGCSGQNVQELQKKLGQLGYSITVDGDYGPRTTAKIRLFQEDANGIMTANSADACDGKPEALALWNLVFVKFCPGIPSDCTVFQEEVDARLLPVNGQADLKTQELLDDLAFPPNDSEFSSYCRSST